MAADGTIRWTVGAIEITRVDDPGFELMLPQDEATAAVLAAIALAVTALRDRGRRPCGSARRPSPCALRRHTIVVDPFLAFDDPARLAPRLARCAGPASSPTTSTWSSTRTSTGSARPSWPMARRPSREPATWCRPLRSTTPAPGFGARPVTRWWPSPTRASPSPSRARRRSRRACTSRTPRATTGATSCCGRTPAGTQAVVTGHLFLHPAQIANPEVDNGDLDPVVLGGHPARAARPVRAGRRPPDRAAVRPARRRQGPRRWCGLAPDALRVCSGPGSSGSRAADRDRSRRRSWRWPRRPGAAERAASYAGFVLDLQRARKLAA